MNKEELENLLDIGCCPYHLEIGKKAKEEIERLNNIIKEAIEWVKKNMYYFPKPDELLNILKGENNGK